MPFQEVGVFWIYDTEAGFREKHLQSGLSTKSLSWGLFNESLIKHQPNSR